MTGAIVVVFDRVPQPPVPRRIHRSVAKQSNTKRQGPRSTELSRKVDHHPPERTLLLSVLEFQGSELVAGKYLVDHPADSAPREKVQTNSGGSDCHCITKVTCPIPETFGVTSVTYGGWDIGVRFKAVFRWRVELSESFTDIFESPADDHHD